MTIPESELKSRISIDDLRSFSGQLSARIPLSVPLL